MKLIFLLREMNCLLCEMNFLLREIDIFTL